MQRRMGMWPRARGFFVVGLLTEPHVSLPSCEVAVPGFDVVESIALTGKWDSTINMMWDEEDMALIVAFRVRAPVAEVAAPFPGYYQTCPFSRFAESREGEGA